MSVKHGVKGSLHGEPAFGTEEEELLFPLPYGNISVIQGASFFFVCLFIGESPLRKDDDKKKARAAFLLFQLQTGVT